MQQMPLRDLARNYERQVVKQLLKDGKSQVEAAAWLNISVRTLQRLLSDDGDVQNSERPLLDA